METRADFPCSAIARLLNITERRVQQLAKEGVIPRSGRGRYPLAGAIRGYVTFLQDTGDGEVSDPDKLKPFERRAFYQGELDKLKLQVERGELVPAFEVERKLARLFKILTQHLDTLPDILERDVGANPKQLGRIEQHLDLARDAMYREIRDDDEDYDDADSPAEKRT